MMLWVDLGLSEEVKKLSSEEQIHIYNEFNGKLEQDCVADLTELFLERSDLFDKISPSPSNTFSPKDLFDNIHQELKVCIYVNALSYQYILQKVFVMRPLIMSMSMASVCV